MLIKQYLIESLNNILIEMVASGEKEKIHTQALNELLKKGINSL